MENLRLCGTTYLQQGFSQAVTLLKARTAAHTQLLRPIIQPYLHGLSICRQLPSLAMDPLQVARLLHYASPLTLGITSICSVLIQSFTFVEPKKPVVKNQRPRPLTIYLILLIIAIFVTYVSHLACFLEMQHDHILEIMD